MVFLVPVKRFLPLVLVSALPLLTGFRGGGERSEPGIIAASSNAPLLAGRYSLQKLPVPLPDGRNLRMQFQCRVGYPIPGAPEAVAFYVGGSEVPVFFYDTGTHGDPVAGDGVYTTLLKEDLGRLLDRIRLAELRLATGKALVLDDRTRAELAQVASFDLEGFNQGRNVPLSVLLAAPSSDGPDGAY